MAIAANTGSGADAGQHTFTVDGIGDHPEVLDWLAEAKRLFVEAEDRLESGQVLPALSSLAAVPPLHRMLVQHCSELLDGNDEEAVEDQPSNGMYL